MGNGMAYSFKITGDMDRDGMMMDLYDMGFSRIRDAGNGISAELFTERTGCKDCMSEHCATPISDRIKSSGYAKDVKVNYSETTLSAATYRTWIALLNTFSPKYRRDMKLINDISKKAMEKSIKNGSSREV